MEAATYVHCNTSEALAEAARRFPGWPLLVTGHSMGGSLSIHCCSRPSANQRIFLLGAGCWMFAAARSRY